MPATSGASRSNFTLTYGVRVDIPTFPDKPTANPVAERTSATRPTRCPAACCGRRGSASTTRSDRTTRSRSAAASGCSPAARPYVWLSNQYGNTGIEFRRLQRRLQRRPTAIPFVPDPNASRRAVGNVADERDRPDRSRLQVPVADARQPRLRPRARRSSAWSARRSSSTRRTSTTSSTRT